MGKSYKDMANFIRFKPDKVEKIDSKISNLASLMERHGKGYRSGNNRKVVRDQKNIRRKLERQDRYQYSDQE